MVDVGGDLLAVGALVVSTFVAWFMWGQLRAQRDQLLATADQLKVDEGKLDRLGELVGSLKGVVETQKAQVAALEKQLDVATKALKLQEETLAFDKAKAERDAQLKQNELELRRTQLAWDQTGPFAKARIWIDKGMEETRRKLRRLFSR